MSPGMGPELPSTAQGSGSPSLAPAWWVWCHLLRAHPQPWHSPAQGLSPSCSWALTTRGGTLSLHGSPDGGDKANPGPPASFLPGQRELNQFHFGNSEGTEQRKEPGMSWRPSEQLR